MGGYPLLTRKSRIRSIIVRFDRTEIDSPWIMKCLGLPMLGDMEISSVTGSVGAQVMIQSGKNLAGFRGQRYIMRVCIMKTLFITSLICAFMSLLAVVSFSAITIVPAPDAESWRSQMILVAGAFFVSWLCLAYWARSRKRKLAPPQWLIRSLVFASIVYVLGVLLFVAG